MLLLILLSRCISFDSYIKPQLLYDGYGIILSCISFDSYIKPQLSDGCPSDTPVVYLLIPTSNHNVTDINGYSERLYIFWFLHQTTTGSIPIKTFMKLYIFWFLHQTTTYLFNSLFASRLYIFWFLHQTTTNCRKESACLRCISFDSYIKPQPAVCRPAHSCVVYLLIPTSNHNWFWCWKAESWLYIFWFLHQTTTKITLLRAVWRCISFDSYIKPQPTDLNILIFSA